MALAIEELLSAEDVTAIRQAQLNAWGVAFALAEPKTRLVLNRNGIELDQQEVAVQWVPARLNRQKSGRAMDEVDSYVIFRRPDPFDVKRGDRFQLQSVTGVVTMEYQDKGLHWAKATIDDRAL